MNWIVVHYKELALKGRNRPWFIQLLVRNLQVALEDLDVQSIRFVTGRIHIELGPTWPWDRVRDRVSRIFGIANFSYAGRAAHDLGTLASAILAALGDRQAESFRVSARRADKHLPWTSPQIERELGGLIQRAKGWSVDLEDPALTISVEMLPDDAFYFLARSPEPADCRRGPVAASPACSPAASIRPSRRTA